MTTDDVNNVYEDIATHFSNTRQYQWKWISDFFSELKINSVVYDLGCGNGRNMKTKGLEMYGIDNCTKFVEICNSQGLNVTNACITNLPFSNKSANAIICIAVFHHLFCYEQRLTALLEMKRVLKKGGIILLSFWSINQPLKTRRVFTHYGDTIVPWNKFGNIYNRYYYIFEIKEFETLVSSAGLKIKKHLYDCGNEIFFLEDPTIIQ